MMANRDISERFLAELVSELAQPSPSRPTTRCLSVAQISEIIGSVRDKLKGEGDRGIGRLTVTQLLQHLQRMGLAQPVPAVVAPENRRGRRPAFYLVGIEKKVDSLQIEPIELLQAHEPCGFVCYFTALAFHGLTTQEPSSHHIALPTVHSRHEPANADGAEPPVFSRDAASAVRVRNPLGRLAFAYEGIGYYVSRRTPRLAPGVQARYLNQRTLIRITTVEQTLLDTLHRPACCGGAEVVFEAWRVREEELDEELLGQYITAMDYSPSARRVGAMLDLMGHEVRTSALASALLPYRDSTAPPIPLLAGIDYQQLDPVWSVLVP